MATRSQIPLIFEHSSRGRRGYRYPALDVPETALDELIPAEHQRQQPPQLPEVSEVEVVRHFTGLSRLNHGVDVGFYPLGSCTMKYNPKVNEDCARMSGYMHLHPYQPAETVQGALALMHRLQSYLSDLAGLHETTLQPAAGAHGELTGLMIMRAFHKANGEDGMRKEMIIPDSAHGTNPASAKMVNYQVREVPSDDRGGVDVDALRAMVGPQTAGLMLTNPNTLGLFDENICEIQKIIHEAGGLLYYDGANANAIMGYVRAGDMGFDIVHFNLHKTFSTPHGGGGPGSGPIAVSQRLAPFLPEPIVAEQHGEFFFKRPSQSIGRVKSFYGNFGVLVRAYAYIRSLGEQGLKDVSETAVLHANYLMRNLQPYYELPYDRHCMHEFVLSGSRQKAHGVRTMDVAKRLLDYGVHAPTVYFPLNVEESIMVEPTETETLTTLDTFIGAMKEIAREAEESPDVVCNAPYETPVRRLDEAQAARKPILRWTPEH